MFEDVEAAFKELDAERFVKMARPLAAYRRSLENEGFSPSEAFQLVKAFADTASELVVQDCLESRWFDEEPEDDDDDTEELVED